MAGSVMNPRLHEASQSCETIPLDWWSKLPVDYSIVKKWSVPVHPKMQITNDTTCINIKCEPSVNLIDISNCQVQFDVRIVMADHTKMPDYNPTTTIAPSTSASTTTNSLTYTTSPPLNSQGVRTSFEQNGQMGIAQTSTTPSSNGGFYPRMSHSLLGSSSGDVYRRYQRKRSYDDDDDDDDDFDDDDDDDDDDLTSLASSSGTEFRLPEKKRRRKKEAENLMGNGLGLVSGSGPGLGKEKEKEKEKEKGKGKGKEKEKEKERKSGPRKRKRAIIADGDDDDDDDDDRLLVSIPKGEKKEKEKEKEKGKRKKLSDSEEERERERKKKEKEWREKEKEWQRRLQRYRDRAMTNLKAEEEKRKKRRVANGNRLKENQKNNLQTEIPMFLGCGPENFFVVSLFRDVDVRISEQPIHQQNQLYSEISYVNYLLNNNSSDSRRTYGELMGYTDSEPDDFDLASPSFYSLYAKNFAKSKFVRCRGPIFFGLALQPR